MKANIDDGYFLCDTSTTKEPTAPERMITNKRKRSEQEEEGEEEEAPAWAISLQSDLKELLNKNADRLRDELKNEMKNEIKNEMRNEVSKLRDEIERLGRRIDGLARCMGDIYEIALEPKLARRIATFTLWTRESPPLKTVQRKLEDSPTAWAGMKQWARSPTTRQLLSYLPQRRRQELTADTQSVEFNLLGLNIDARQQVNPAVCYEATTARLHPFNPNRKPRTEAESAFLAKILQLERQFHCLQDDDLMVIEAGLLCSSLREFVNEVRDFKGWCIRHQDVFPRIAWLISENCFFMCSVWDLPPPTRILLRG